MIRSMQTAVACSLTSVFRTQARDSVCKPYIHADLFSVAFDLLVVWDAVSVLLAGVIGAMACSVGASGSNWLMLDEEILQMSLVGAVLSPVVLRERWSHLAVSTIPPRTLVARVAARVSVAAGLIFAVAVVTKSASRLPYSWALTWLIGAILTVALGRFLLIAALRSLARRGLVADSVAVLGSGPAAEWLQAKLAEARPYGVTTVVAPASGVPDQLEGALADLLERGRRGQLDRVILALPNAEEAELQAVAHRLKALRIEVTSLYPALGQRGATVRSTQIAGVPLYLITGRPHYRWGVLAKAIEDRLLALLMLIALSPVLALVALAVRLGSPGPVIFRQRRHGLNGTEFDVYKFRTMVWQGGRAGSGEVQTGRRDRRVTRVGAVLRSTSLDELPQLLNVLNGTMSLVGPRPHPVSMRTEQLLGDEIIAEYAHRHRVKPGITGWAQVNGLRGATDTAEKLRRRVEHDIYYIEHWSLPFDLLILASTVISVLFKRDNAF